MTLLTTQGLTVERGGAAIVDDIHLNIQAGERVMLVGPNGAGKSTLLQRLAGVQPLSRGSIHIQGQPTAHWRHQDWAQALAYLPQLSLLNFPLSVREVVQLGAMPHSDSVVALRRQVLDALERWDIHWLADRDVRLLSGGEQQRCQLARSWLQMQAPQSRLWLLDEPLSALDLRHQQQCLQHIHALAASGRSVVMVVHDLNLALRHADRVLLLCCGRLVADGRAQDVLTAERVSEVFGVATRLEGGYLQWL